MDFPDPWHWIELGKHSDSIYLDVFDPSITDGGGIDGELLTGCGEGRNWTEELRIEGSGWCWSTASRSPPIPLAAIGDLVAEKRARIPGARVGFTTENCELYLAGPSLERPVCVHEVPKLVALYLHRQISYLFRPEACDEPCRVSVVGPQLPAERKDVLRDAVRRIDVRPLRAFLDAPELDAPDVREALSGTWADALRDLDSSFPDRWRALDTAPLHRACERLTALA